MKLQSTLRENTGFLYTAPLVDVLLLLLIFFLLNSSFVLKSGISVEVPASSASLPSIDAAWIVTVERGPTPRIYVNEHLVTMDQIPDRLDDSPESIRHIIIRADIASEYGTVVQISNLILGMNREFELAWATTSS